MEPKKMKTPHKDIEKKRRDRMKWYFDELESLIPEVVRKNSNKRRKLDKIGLLSETNEYIESLMVHQDYLTAGETDVFHELGYHGFNFVVAYPSLEIVHMAQTVENILGYKPINIHQMVKDMPQFTDFIDRCLNRNLVSYKTCTNESVPLRFDTNAAKYFGPGEKAEHGTSLIMSKYSPSANIRLNAEFTEHNSMLKNCFCCDYEKDDQQHILMNLSGNIRHHIPEDILVGFNNYQLDRLTVKENQHYFIGFFKVMKESEDTNQYAYISFDLDAQVMDIDDELLEACDCESEYPDYEKSLSKLMDESELSNLKNTIKSCYKTRENRNILLTLNFSSENSTCYKGSTKVQCMFEIFYNPIDAKIEYGALKVPL